MNAEKMFVIKCFISLIGLINIWHLGYISGTHSKVKHTPMPTVWKKTESWITVGNKQNDSNKSKYRNTELCILKNCK